MKNLFENANDINKRLLADIIADMKVYRIESYICMLIYDLIYYVRKLFSKNHNSGIYKKSFKSEIVSYSSELQDNRRYSQQLTKWIKYHSLRGSFMLLSSSAGSDSISFAASNTASKILDRDERKGKSVYEITDSVYRRYADKKKDNFGGYLILWLVIALLIIVSTIIVGALFHIPFIFDVLIIVVGEFVDYLLISRVIGIQQMARFVWLVVSECGTSQAADRYAIDLLDNTSEHKMEVVMRALHSVINSSEISLKDILTMEEDCNKSQKILENNNRMIRELLKKNDDESRRLVDSKNNENKKLIEDVNRQKELINRKRASYTQMRQIIEKLTNWAADELMQIWKSEYVQLKFEKDYFRHTVADFSFSDMKNIEKRLFEIKNTADPRAIAKKVSSAYELDFLTAQGGLASIGFETSGKTVTIIYTKRNDRLVEGAVSGDELKEAVGLIHSDDNSVNTEKMLGEIEKLNEENSKLSSTVSGLENEKQNLLNEMITKGDEIAGLSDEVSRKDEFCKKLQAEIERLNNEGAVDKAKVLRQKLNETKNELQAKEQELQKALNDNNALVDRLDAVNKEKDKLIRDFAESEKNLSAVRENLKNAKAEIGDKKKKIQEYEEREQTVTNQIITFNGLLKRADGNTSVNGNTIEKIKKSKSQLENELLTLGQNIKKTDEQIAELNKNVEKANKEVITAEARNKDLEGRIKQISGGLLYRKDIYTELYRWIASAKKYIYIIAPFVGENQFDTMKNKLQDALLKNPSLKVKILYGMQDRNSKGKFGIMKSCSIPVRKCLNLKKHLARL